MTLKQVFVKSIKSYVDERPTEDVTTLASEIENIFKDAMNDTFSLYDAAEKKEKDEELKKEEVRKDVGCTYIFQRGKNSGKPCGVGKKHLCGKHDKHTASPAPLLDSNKALAPFNVKKPKTTKMPKKIPIGSVVKNVSGDAWILGPSIGKGGFGEIYSARQEGGTHNDFAVKIEPHTNGPLFVEMNFYIRAAKAVDIEKFKGQKQLKALGMPRHIGNGSYVHGTDKYRFIVMEKFDTDIWRLYLKNKKYFEPAVVLKLSLQTLHVLEYIHSMGYVHADIKGANMLLKDSDPNQVYLVDFGLCCHYDKDYKPDPKRAHNGTLEYISRDGHCGVQSKRGDLEILGYNMIMWSGGILPWGQLKNPKAVHESKKGYMMDLPLFFKDAFGYRICKDNDKSVPLDTLKSYFNVVTSMPFQDPDYVNIENIITSSSDYNDSVSYM
jgi:vaccinia related kinase